MSALVLVVLLPLFAVASATTCACDAGHETLFCNHTMFGALAGGCCLPRPIALGEDLCIAFEDVSLCDSQIQITAWSNSQEPATTLIQKGLTTNMTFFGHTFVYLYTSNWKLTTFSDEHRFDSWQLTLYATLTSPSVNSTSSVDLPQLTTGTTCHLQVFLMPALGISLSSCILFFVAALVLYRRISKSEKMIKKSRQMMLWCSLAHLVLLLGSFAVAVWGMPIYYNSNITVLCLLGYIVALVGGLVVFFCYFPTHRLYSLIAFFATIATLVCEYLALFVTSLAGGWHLLPGYFSMLAGCAVLPFSIRRYQGLPASLTLSAAAVEALKSASTPSDYQSPVLGGSAAPSPQQL